MHVAHVHVHIMYRGLLDVGQFTTAIPIYTVLLLFPIHVYTYVQCVGIHHYYDPMYEAKIA